MVQPLVLPFIHAEWFETPAVVVHRPTLDRNIARMAALAADAKVALRPHVKAHKTVEIARRQRMAGTQGITVAKLGEAEVFAEAGFRDITVAYPVISAVKRDRLAALAARARVTTVVDDLEQVDLLARMAEERAVTVGLWLKVDTGLHRCGIPAAEEDRAAAVVSRILLWEKRWREEPGGGVYFAGLLTHAGHAYGAESKEEVEAIAKSEGEQLAALKKALQMRGLPTPALSAGSTPTAARVSKVPGISEIRPGNYVFNDRTQVRLGAANPEDCSLRVVARVVSRPTPDRCVIDAGAKTLALDQGAHGSSGLEGFGVLCGKEGLRVTRLSEEHGVIERPNSGVELPRVGEVVELIPNHACPVVNLTRRLGVVGEAGWEGWWSVDAQGRVE
ncbi:alanine racemase [Kyrpidia sp.]|uniref:alanine racemase n=1 Tax=Kyrpidia sp. TaxID=2073077 RepID=UPI00258FC7EC|nr:alanine racemase [Kyrpidia sp.]MCL6576061.1 alanine racemase [Kyrpidia sp.]